MPTSGDTSFPTKLTKVDAMTVRDHHHLVAQDQCYFLGEYTSGELWGYSPTNGLIWNLKKPMSAQRTPAWRHKGRAIKEAGAALKKALGDVSAFSIVPIPPSKTKTDPEYDDRVVAVLRAAFGNGADVREIITQLASREPFHTNSNTRDPAALIASYAVNDQMLAEAKQDIILFDDVLTTGCSFCAARSRILQVRPAVNIYGVFLARRAPKPIVFEP